MSDNYERDDTGPPNVRNMTDNRKIIMMLMAGGARNIEIAREFGYSETYISVMRNSPLFRAQIAELQKQFREGRGFDVMEIIEREAMASVEMLVSVRENNGDDKAADRNVQRQAANDILDRNPKFAKRRQDEVEHIHRLVFSTEDVKRMAAAMPTREARVIEAEVEK